MSSLISEKKIAKNRRKCNKSQKLDYIDSDFFPKEKIDLNGSILTGAPATNFARKRVKTRYLTLFRATKNCVVICSASLFYEMGYPFRSTVFVPMEF